MSSREILQQFLSVFSCICDDDSGTCKASGANAAPGQYSTDLVTSNHMSENGIQLQIPCLDAKPQGTDRRPYEIPFPTAVLELLLKQHNLWRHNKRNLNHFSSEKPRPENEELSSSASITGCDDENSKDLLDCKQKEMCRRNSKKETIQSRIDRVLEFSIPNIKGQNDGTSNLSKAIQTMHSNLKETIKILVYEILVSLTAKLLHKSITTNGIINIQTAKNLAGSLPSIDDMNTELTDHITVLKSLENWKPQSLEKECSKKFVSEEEDAQIVAKSLQKFQPSFPGNRESKEKKFSSEEEDAQLVAVSLKAYPSSCSSNTCGGGCGLEGNRIAESLCGHKKSMTSSKETYRDECIHPALCRASSLPYRHLYPSNGNADGKLLTCNGGLSHIATIKTIHNQKSIKDALYAAAIDSTRIEASNRLVKISIKKYANVFACKSDSEVDASGGSIDPTRVAMPIQMDCKVAIQIGNYDFDIEFEAPGFVTGNFDNQSFSLTKVHLTLNDKVLVENLFQEIYRSTKTLIISKKSILETVEFRTTERSNVHSSGDHLEAAHALSQISASPILQKGKKKYSVETSPKRNVKRVRIDSTDMKSSSLDPCRRRSRMSSLDMVTEAIRIAEDGQTRKFSDINENNRETWFQLPKFGGASDIDMAIGSLRRGSESGGYGDSSAASFLPRGSGSYNMAVAAEAVRLADAENNLNSLANFYEMNGSHNGNVNGTIFPSPNPAALGRRPSYSNNSVSHGAQEGRIQNVLGGEGRSLHPGYFASTGMDSHMMNQGNRGNGNLNSAQSNFWMENWYGNATAMNPETMYTSNIQAESRRRSSLTEAIRLVEMEVLRRSSAGMSMAAAAEAVRLSEMNPYMNNQRRQSFAPTAESLLTHSESFDNLAAMMRRSSGPNGSMASAAHAVSLAELENWSRRSFTGHNAK